MLVYLPIALAASVFATDPWTRIGPWNIFDAINAKGEPEGEAGTLACAASPASNPLTIYAGGQNNGVSSGILKTTDGGKHWERKSQGIWDTQINGVWVHPDDETHIFAGTHSGIYESHDSAETWSLRDETKDYGTVMSFREGVINGVPFILANSGGNGILTLPRAGGTWQKTTKPPGGIASNAHLSVVTPKGAKSSEVLTCIGGWGGGQLYYARLDTPTNVTWTGPLVKPNHTYTRWETFTDQSVVWGKCQTPTKCNADVHPLGAFATEAACRQAVNATTNLTVAGFAYMKNDTSLKTFAGWCYVLTSFTDWEPHAQDKVVSGRAPGLFPGGAIDCANAAVDPNDRNHFLYSKGGKYNLWESVDGGKTVHQVVNFTSAAYFVMIAQNGDYYTATQAGAFRSLDRGYSFQPLHVIMHRRSGGIMDRVPHDYQRIVPDFRGDQIALPSDQGLHIVNGTNTTLISAVGDLHNNMALSAIISPSRDGTSRNVIVNLWDWDVGASWDDGATWAGWNKTEKSPGSCGEGGGGIAMGMSGKAIMFHHQHWYASGDGGHNWIRGNLPGGGGAFDYLRKVGSRSEPNGTCFALMTAPASGEIHGEIRALDDDGDDDDDDDDEVTAADNDDDDDEDDDGRNYRPDAADADDDDDDDDDDEMNPNRLPYEYRPGLLPAAPNGNKVFLMTSSDFGQTWNWTQMPDKLQARGLSVDPSSNRLFALTETCLANSTDSGKSWSPCSTAPGLSGKFSKLLVKNEHVLFLLRSGAVPLRTTDGGKSWYELSTAAPLYAHGATYGGALSWSGSTLVLHGADRSAISRKQFPTAVWRTLNDGMTWLDETADIVSISPGAGVWYDEDFYFVTSGEGVMVKRGFDKPPKR